MEDGLIRRRPLRRGDISFRNISLLRQLVAGLFVAATFRREAPCPGFETVSKW